MAHRLRLLEQYDIGGRLKRIRVPTLVLAGKRDMLVSEESLNLLASGLPKVKVCSLEDCGHLACVTHPERIAKEVERFVRISNPETTAV
jgi:pimeloyl-[acyl-carrier protein] methyl ester esterase